MLIRDSCLSVTLEYRLPSWKILVLDTINRTLWEGQKIPHRFVVYPVNLRGRFFFKFLWSSHIILTLKKPKYSLVVSDHPSTSTLCVGKIFLLFVDKISDFIGFMICWVLNRQWFSTIFQIRYVVIKLMLPDCFFDSMNWKDWYQHIITYYTSKNIDGMQAALQNLIISFQLKNFNR